MRGSVRIPATLAALAVTASIVAAPHAQGQAPSIALRTNGSTMRPGDCLRIEAIALDFVAGPFAIQVTYRYEQPVIVRDEAGTEATVSRPAQVQRPVGPSIEALNALQVLPLDDTFCFGQGTVPGHYRVEVTLLAGHSGPSIGTLTTCAFFDDGGLRPTGAGPGCGFLVRGVKRIDSADIIVFDAELAAGGIYRGAILRGGAVDTLLDAGVYQTGPDELTVISTDLGRADGSTLDLVVFEQSRGASSTAVRLSLPRKN